MKFAPCLYYGFVLAASWLQAKEPLIDARAPVKTRPLTVVHTFGELLAQKPVTLPNGATCRLGIDRTAAKRYSGVVLYCFAQGEKIPSQSEDRLGPFDVAVDAPSATELRAFDAVRQIAATVEEKTKGADRLYMKVVPVDKSGTYTIHISLGEVGNPKSDPEEAFATVKVAAESAPRWSPWPLNALGGEVGLLAASDDEDRTTCAGGVANPSTGVALPKLPHSVEIARDKLPAATTLLPQLFPATPGHGIKMQLSGNLLIVTLDRGIDADFPDENFLSRWWVNGKPFVPGTKSPEFSADYGMRHNGARTTRADTQICFEVEFHPEALGAKKGDTIGVQLLLCPQGAELFPDETGAAPMAEALQYETAPTETLMTERLTFPCTGDPARMAPLPLRPAK